MNGGRARADMGLTPGFRPAERQSRGEGLFRGDLSGFRQVAPSATEQLGASAFVLGYHRRNRYDSHDHEDEEENDCNRQDWHAAPLSVFCGAGGRSLGDFHHRSM